jgi:NAD(P)-dependent dehydrogenase (short-subunit alcohol dehydrogenase family)
MRLENRVAIVTGAGRGIGRAIALAYAGEGARLVLNDVDEATLATTAAEANRTGRTAQAVPGDVAAPADVARLVETAVRELGRVDIVVNNAIRIVPGRLEDLPLEAWDATMNVGLRGPFLLGQAAASHMIRQGSGAIVNIASVAGLFPYNLAGAYSVVKAGLIMLTRLQAVEWGPHGIRANAIAPGFIRTPGAEAMYADPEIFEGRRKGVPLGRIGTPEEVAAIAVFLASDEARYTSGIVLGVDGGQAVGLYLGVPGRRFSGGRID